MTIIGQVRQNGVALGSDAVVAVYCGDEIRGKGRPFSDKNHTNIFQFVVHGDGNTNGDPLIFKVYTGGKIIEVDQGLTYQNNATIGYYDNYYYIDLGLRGDANGDGSVSVTDIAVVVNSILQSVAQPCLLSLRCRRQRRRLGHGDRHRRHRRHHLRAQQHPETREYARAPITAPKTRKSPAAEMLRGIFLRY